MIDPNKAARVVIDAITLGDKGAASKHRCAPGTVARYRARIDSDPELAARVVELGAQADRQWALLRLKSLRHAVERANELIENAETIEDLPAITEHIRVLGDLDLASRILSPPQTEVIDAPPNDE